MGLLLDQRRKKHFTLVYFTAITNQLPAPPAPLICIQQRWTHFSLRVNNSKRASANQINTQSVSDAKQPTKLNACSFCRLNGHCYKDECHVTHPRVSVYSFLHAFTHSQQQCMSASVYQQPWQRLLDTHTERGFTGLLLCNTENM